MTHHSVLSDRSIPHTLILFVPTVATPGTFLFSLPFCQRDCILCISGRRERPGLSSYRERERREHQKSTTKVFSTEMIKYSLSTHAFVTFSALFRFISKCRFPHCVQNTGAVSPIPARHFPSPTAYFQPFNLATTLFLSSTFLSFCYNSE